MLNDLTPQKNLVHLYILILIKCKLKDLFRGTSFYSDPDILFAVGHVQQFCHDFWKSSWNLHSIAIRS